MRHADRGRRPVDGEKAEPVQQLSLQRVASEQAAEQEAMVDAETEVEAMVDAETEIEVEECKSLPQHLPQGANWRINCTRAPTKKEPRTDYCKPLPGNETTWTTLKGRRKRASSVSASSSIKLAVLMMAMDKVENAEVWLNWMKDAQKAKLPFQLIIHAKKTESKEGVVTHPEWKTPELLEFVMNESAEALFNRWCKVGGAEWLLMERALKDPLVTHLAVVSSDAIPIKPLSYIVKEITKQPATRMCMDWNSHEPRAETWWIMSRADAELLVEHKGLVDPTFRPLHRCEEERMWAYPLLLRSFRWGQEAAPFYDDCVMFTDWSDTCKVWGLHVDAQMFTELRGAQHKKACQAHPRTYSSLPRKAVEELLRSPFWWARKFSPDVARVHDFQWNMPLLS